jgi:hypothetical protein
MALPQAATSCHTPLLLRDRSKKATAQRPLPQSFILRHMFVCWAATISRSAAVAT